jgi:Leucine-rich repeat (LRR) protein
MLPRSIASLPFLEIIEAQQNKLEDFVPFQRPFFKTLHHLNLTNNRISQISTSILKLPKLRTLILAYNKLTNIEPLWSG